LEPVVYELAFRPPFDWEALRTFLVGRVSLGVEALDGNRYVRAASFGDKQGWISIEPAASSHALRVELSPSLASAAQPLLSRINHLFDLDAEPEAIATHLGPLAAAHPGLRIPGAFDGFEMAVRAILGQQISVRAATTLAGRFVRAFGEPIATPFAQVTHLTPTPQRVADAAPEEIIALGIISSRAKSIQALACAVSEGSIVIQPGCDVIATMSGLKELPGIGEWTAQYIAMRAMGWRDAFPHTDLGIYKALGMNNPKRVLEIAEAWRPWRAYAAMHLWKSLETNGSPYNATIAATPHFHQS
jgi:AraC family transcriptional regulator of adaptative response / DNA-3-methyladenine glycosylase II